MRRLTTDEILKRLYDIHGDKYDYSNTKFGRTRDDIEVKCNKCGNVFKQTLKRHLNGQGCPECGKAYAATYQKGNYQHFIDRCAAKYGNKFSFPNIEDEFVNVHCKITIHCNDCGNTFRRIAGDFLKSTIGGCPKCREKELRTKYKRINKRKIKYFSYDDLKNILIVDANIVKFEGKKAGNEDVDIICPTHGKYTLKANTIFRRKKCNCKRCTSSLKGQTTEEFVKRATKHHNGRYSYEKTDMLHKRSDGAICITCPEHGDFWQLPYNHLRCIPEKACQKCTHPRKYTTETFIERLKEIRGDIFDTSKLDYKGTDEDVCIICHEKDEFGDEHGEFWVTPHSLISMKTGCPKCSQKFGSYERFKKLATKKYNGFYSYDNFVYKNAITPSLITCPEHGDFEMSANQHLSGRGCPTCSYSGMEQDVLHLLKANNIKYIPQYHNIWLGLLSLDFYLPEYNVAIECQGLQHFEPIKFFGGEDTFERILEHDKIKKERCEKQGVKLLYYSDINYDFPYEIISNKDKLLKEIKHNGTDN